MKVIIATNNPDKVKEIKKIWSDINEIELSWLGEMNEEIDIEETGKTLDENALIKSRTVSERYNCIAVADDTGLFVEYINGAPGVRSARYAGENATYNDNVEKLLASLEEAPEESRKAEFRCAVSLSRPAGDDIVVEGSVEGKITTEKRGEMGFGYDPVFEVKGTDMTFAEMTAKQKNAISHRFIAFNKMGEEIKKLSRGVAQFG